MLGDIIDLRRAGMRRRLLEGGAGQLLRLRHQPFPGEGRGAIADQALRAERGRQEEGGARGGDHRAPIDLRHGLGHGPAKRSSQVLYPARNERSLRPGGRRLQTGWSFDRRCRPRRGGDC